MEKRESAKHRLGMVFVSFGPLITPGNTDHRTGVPGESTTAPMVPAGQFRQDIDEKRKKWYEKDE